MRRAHAGPIADLAPHSFMILGLLLILIATLAVVAFQPIVSSVAGGGNDTRFSPLTVFAPPDGFHETPDDPHATPPRDDHPPPPDDHPPPPYDHKPPPRPH